MGDIAKGNRTIWGFRHETTYATPVVVGADHGVVMGSSGEGISHTASAIPDDNLEGEHQEFFSETGSETIAGDLANPPLMYDSIYHMLAHALGEAAAPVAVVQVVEGVNDSLDFTEGTSGAAVATITPGNYAPADYAAAVQAAMNAAATDNTYTCDYGVTGPANTFNISRNVGADTIDLNWNTGPNAATTCGVMMGYSVAADDTGLTSYDADGTVIPDSYLHVLTPPGLMNSAMGTFIYGQLGLYLKEFVSTMFNGFTLDYPNQGKVNCVLPAVPHTVNFDDTIVAAADKPVNTLTTLASVSRPGERDTALWRQSVVRWNAQAGAALAAADNKKCASMQVIANNNFVTDDFTLEFAGARSNISQPVRDNKVQFTGSFTFSRLQADIQDLIIGMRRDRQKATIVTTSGAIPGAGNTGQRYQIAVYLPDIQFDVEANVGGPGRVPKNVSFMAQAVSGSAPTGFPAGYTDGVTIEIVNSRNVNALTQL